jgi:hypothetical protein
LYSAEEQAVIQKPQQNDSNAWVMPVVGLVGMFSFAAGFGVSRRRQGARDVQPAMPDVEALLDDSLQ